MLDCGYLESLVCSSCGIESILVSITHVTFLLVGEEFILSHHLEVQPSPLSVDSELAVAECHGDGIVGLTWWLKLLLPQGGLEADG